LATSFLSRIFAGSRSRLLGLCAVAWAASAAPAVADEGLAPALEFRLDASGLYGHLTGYLQVPEGGTPGTTSPHRPTLREIGIEDTVFWEIEPRLRWQHLIVFGGYSGLDADGSGILSEPLVSHSVSFAAGTPIHSALQLDVADVGAGWRFDFPALRLDLSPTLDFALLDFGYSLRSPGQRTERSFREGAVRLGGEVALDLGRGFELEFGGKGSLPIAHMPQLAELGGRVSYHAPLGPVRLGAFLGSGIRWYEFEDSQQVPNHIHVRTGALLTWGLSLTY
jgi:hypothetical protein